MPDREFKIKITTTADSAGAQQQVNDLAKVGEAGKKATREIGDETEKLLVKKRDWRAMVKGLSTEFPALGHIARLAINPLAGAVAAVVASFAIWRERTQELIRTLAGLELPQISSAEVGHIDALSAAWAKYNAELRKVSETYQSVNAANDRAVTEVREELQLRLKLLEALEKLAKAKGESGEREHQQTRLTEEQAQYQEIEMAEHHAIDLKFSAERKRKEANKIHVASAEDDAKTEKDLASAAEAAKKNQDERKERIGDLVGFDSGDQDYAARTRVMGRQFLTGMSVAELLALEREGVATDQAPITRYNDWMRNKPARNEARQLRSNLFGQSAAEEGEANQIISGLPQAASMVDQRVRVGQQVDTIQSLTTAYGELGTARSHQEELSKQIAEGARSGTRIMAETLRQLSEWTAAVRGLEERIRSLENTRRAAPPAL